MPGTSRKTIPTLPTWWISGTSLTRRSKESESKCSGISPNLLPPETLTKSSRTTKRWCWDMEMSTTSSRRWGRGLLDSWRPSLNWSQLSRGSTGSPNCSFSASSGACLKPLGTSSRGWSLPMDEPLRWSWRSVWLSN